MSALIQGPQVQVNCMHSAVANTVVTLNDAAITNATSGEGFEVVSTDNTQDKAAGTGALTIGIDYLDATGVWHHDTIVLNGTTAAVSGNADYWRVNDAYVLAAGSGGTNVGTITGRKVSAGGDKFKIAAARSTAALGQFTVPLGYEFAFLEAKFSGAVLASAVTPLKVQYWLEAEMGRADGSYTAGIWNILGRTTTALGREGKIQPPRNTFFVVPALATIRARAVTDNASGIEISGSFWGTLRPTS